MIPVLRVIMALLFGSAAAWFVRYRYDRKEASAWFVMWLIATAASDAFFAVSYWVADESISMTFWVASFVSLSLGIFFIFAFARSFSLEATYALFFWSLPLMFGVSLSIVGSEALFLRSGRAWIPKGWSAAFVIQVAVIAFYVLLALYYAVVLYLDLRAHSGKQELSRFGFIFLGVALIFLSISVGGWLKMDIDPEIPFLEVGTLVGAILVLRGIVRPRMGFVRTRSRGVE